MINLIDELNKCDTTYEFDRIYNLLKQLINSNVSIKEIDEKCHKLTSYKIIDYLIRYSNDTKSLNAIKDYYNSLKIDQYKCLVIADNHLGRLRRNEDVNNSFHENERGIYSVYNHALIYGIKNVIHLGDLIEGESEPNQYRLTIPCQLEYLERIYPKTNNIKTYLLYGNHDYNAIYFNNVDDKFYKVCPNTELIGLNYSYINFHNNIIKLSHESKLSEHYENIKLLYNFELSGHSHNFNIYDNLRYVSIPSISTVTTDMDSVGYIEMSDEGNKFLFKFFDQKGKEVPKKEKVLSKYI